MLKHFNSSHVAASKIERVATAQGLSHTYVLLYDLPFVHHHPPPPIKDKQRRDVSLSTFGDADKTKSFDYGGRMFSLPVLGDDDDDVDDDQMVIVDLSLLDNNLHR